MSMSMSNASQVVIGKSNRNRHLILHYGINNTLIMKDTQNGVKTVQLQVAKLIAKSAWGCIEPPADKDEEAKEGEDVALPKPVWKLMHPDLSWNKPAAKKDEMGELVEMVCY